MLSSALHGAGFCTNDGGLSTPNGGFNYLTTRIIDYTVGGKTTSKPIISSTATPTVKVGGDSTILIDMFPDEGCNITWLFDITGTVHIAQSRIERISNQKFISLPEFSDFDDSVYVPFGYSILLNNTATIFDIGVTNWNAAGVFTVTKSVITLPSRPDS